MHNKIQLIFLVFTLGLGCRPANGQSVYPELPRQDYTVYTVIINSFPNCNDPSKAYLQNSLLLIQPVTETRSRYGFRFDFSQAQESLSYLIRPRSSPIRPQASFYTEPAWKKFIATLDTNQFTKFTLTQLIQPQCQKAVLWSGERMEYYFGKETARDRGYYALRKDYENFGGIVRFSRVAYAEDGRKALCYFSNVSDARAGEGSLIFLEKSGESWNVVGKAVLWVA
jgi:hypothetical protein